MDPVLVHLPYSPWSEKARWALDHHRIRHHRVEHLPWVYEPLLRIASRNLREKASVPRLFVGGRVIGDSLEIAEWADTVGSAAPLLPEEKKADIFVWVDRGEELLGAGRARLLERMLASRPALREALPPPLRLLGGAGVALARTATAFVQKKYVAEGQSMASREAKMVAVLEKLRAAIRGGAPLLGSFSFADIAMATALSVIDLRPEVPLGREQRKAWAEPTLASAFPDVLAWRDGIYAAHR